MTDTPHMLKIPFEIPQSLVSYAEQFEQDPQKAMRRLEKQLSKRGADAVGYFLLACLFYRQDQQKRAIEAALKARVFAPGSPFFQRFHYFLSHPRTFEAWTPNTPVASSSEFIDHSGPILDLDSLIEKLSEAKAQKIDSKRDTSDSAGSSANISTDVDGIYSETLARIYEDQGKLDTAIHSYRQLKKIKPKKKDHFDQQIERLQKLAEKSEKE
ncbi:MAG TPA: hypothetical protein VK112_05305 [Fodinibius sp.]|nr:hypothetical protein [Fodinibius sp.]